MSRSGYNDEADDMWAHIMWRGAVAASVKGKRGQEFLRELIAALDAMSEKRLISDALIRKGEVCAIGSVGVARGISMDGLDPEDADRVSKAFNIAPAMAREIVFMNDEAGAYNETPEQRWVRIRAWAGSNLRKATTP